MKTKIKIGDDAGASLVANKGVSDGVRLRGIVHVECFRSDGSLKWEDHSENLVVNTGLDYVIANGLVTPTLYVGLVAATPTIAAGDTMASHAGWTLFTAYDEAARQAWTEAGASSQTITNSASKAVFTISTDSSSVGGAFITTDSTKSGTSGTLVSAVAFTGGNKAADDGDVLNVTYTYTFADDGA